MDGLMGRCRTGPRFEGFERTRMDLRDTFFDSKDVSRTLKSCLDCSR